MPDLNFLNNLRIPTKGEPLRILTSACLVGTLCGVDGSSNGVYPNIIALSKYETTKITGFCPEHFAFGTPRETPDIEGGTGADVLEGKAKVITETGKDITAGMIAGAKEMLAIAQAANVELAVLMDMSGACGSQITYKGHRMSDNHSYQIGMGVCAALLHRNGVKIVSQRDYRSLEILFSKIDPNHKINLDAIDHHETDWYQSYFSEEIS